MPGLDPDRRMFGVPAVSDKGPLLGSGISVIPESDEFLERLTNRDWRMDVLWYEWATDLYALDAPEGCDR